MKNSMLTERLQNEVTALLKTAEKTPKEAFFKQLHAEKWSIGQNIAHLCESSKPLVSPFGKPELMEQFGRSSRTSQTYEDVMDMYVTALRTPPPRLLAYRHIDTEGSKTEILGNLHSISTKLLERVGNFSDNDLDIYQIKHPLLGLMTAREMLHFTAYHTRHHHDIIEKIVVSFPE